MKSGNFILHCGKVGVFAEISLKSLISDRTFANILSWRGEKVLNILLNLKTLQNEYIHAEIDTAEKEPSSFGTICWHLEDLAKYLLKIHKKILAAKSRYRPLVAGPDGDLVPVGRLHRLTPRSKTWSDETPGRSTRTDSRSREAANGSGEVCMCHLMKIIQQW